MWSACCYILRIRSLKECSPLIRLCSLGSWSQPHTSLCDPPWLRMSCWAQIPVHSAAAQQGKWPFDNMQTGRWNANCICYYELSHHKDWVSGGDGRHKHHLRQYILHITLVIFTVHMYGVHADWLPAIIQVTVSSGLTISCSIIQPHILSSLHSHTPIAQRWKILVNSTYLRLVKCQENGHYTATTSANLWRIHNRIRSCASCYVYAISLCCLSQLENVSKFWTSSTAAVCTGKASWSYLSCWGQTNVKSPWHHAKNHLLSCT